jgi:hypothetical protein
VIGGSRVQKAVGETAKRKLAETKQTQGKNGIFECSSTTSLNNIAING